MIPGSANPLLLATAAGAGGGYEIERSLRFNSSDSAYLSRTPASAGNRKTWTWAGWVKGVVTSENPHLFTCTTGATDATYFRLWFVSDSIRVSNYNNNLRQTSAVYRDPSAWYHVVLAVDTTQATAANRIKLYVNGSEVTAFSSSVNPNQNDDLGINQAAAHSIGATSAGTATLSGYLADIHFIDGQALDPSSFGEFDTNGVWQPIAYSGSYGTNGFHLPFSDNSTAAALGTDTSGNGNTWTVNNISVTAGAGNDSLVDSPTNYGTDTGAGGEVRGNYATWNILDKGSGLSLANGNLEIVSVTNDFVRSTLGMSSGKWYAEYTQGTGLGMVGIADGKAYNTLYLGQSSGGNGYGYYSAGTTYTDGAGGVAYGASYTTGDVVGIAFDADNGTLVFYKNGSSQGTAFTGLTSGPYFFAAGVDTMANSHMNFGQRQFSYAAPAGFKALCTTNLPEPTIADGSTAMDVDLYTGTSASHTRTLGFSPDLVWIKQRGGGTAHCWYDIQRGSTLALRSNATTAEADIGSSNSVTFNSNGYTLGADSAGFTNYTGVTYVAWTWDAGSSTVTNTQGSITSQVRANASAGFSVVTYTSTSGSFTVGHGLNAPPAFIVNKDRDNANNWLVYHSALGGTKGLSINLADPAYTDNGYWNDTDPTSSVFTAGAYHAFSGAAARVAYCFAPVAGYSAFGSHTGNGSANGPFVYTGFRPRWVLIKVTSGVSSSWVLYDSERSIYNVVGDFLQPNASDAEVAAADVDFLSNGFKIRINSSYINGSTYNYIYAAFAEHPFATSRAR